MLDRFKRAWHAFNDTPSSSFNYNQQKQVFTDRSREWLDIKFAPRGVKIHLLTKGGIATHGQVTDKTEFQFVGWEPLPSTPHWMKELTR